jgi:hypothetical protein
MRVGLGPVLIVVSTLSCRTRGAPDARQTAATSPATDTPMMTTAPLQRPADAGAPSAFPRCEAPPDDVPELTRYMNVDHSHPYWVPVVFTGHEWLPEKLILPPHHHGSRLELDNIDQYPELDGQRARRLRFTVMVTRVETRKVPDRYQWRSSFHATIQNICELAPR